MVANALAKMPDVRYELRDLMIVEPVKTPDGSPVIGALDRAIARILGTSARLVASPGTFDQKHVDANRRHS